MDENELLARVGAKTCLNCGAVIDRKLAAQQKVTSIANLIFKVAREAPIEASIMATLFPGDLNALKDASIETCCSKCSKELK